MPLTAAEFRSLQTVLRYAREQIEEAGNIVASIAPATLNSVSQMARLKNVWRLIQDEIALLDSNPPDLVNGKGPRR